MLQGSGILCFLSLNLLIIAAGIWDSMLPVLLFINQCCRDLGFYASCPAIYQSMLQGSGILYFLSCYLSINAAGIWDPVYDATALGGQTGWIWDTRCHRSESKTSVADPWHFGVDPDPRNYASHWWIRIRILIWILLFLSLTQETF